MKKKRNRFRFAAVLGLFCMSAGLLLSGCATVGPDYMRPDIPIPTKFSDQSGLMKAGASDPEALARWWTLLNDPLLTDLVQRAVSGNLDLKKAVARVKEVRSRGRVVDSQLLPFANAVGAGSVTRSRDDTGDWNSRESYGVGVDASWEVDLFGGTRREVEAAQDDYQASQEALNDVLVSLTAEVASSYVMMRTYEKRLEVARDNLRLQTETLELTRIMFQSGLAGELNVQQATYNLESTKAQIPTLEAGIEEMKNRLAVLLGVWTEELRDKLSAPGPIPTGDLETAVGIPADLLRRRPDVRAAERRLAAQTARIGVAESDLYPKLTLNGSLGYQALSLSDLISPAHFAAVFGGGISWKIFNLEAVHGNIEIQNALQEQAMIEYEATLRTAVEEVENALTGLVKETQRQETLAKGVKAAQEAASLALQEYENGLSDFQNVLGSQQSLRAFDDRLADSRGQATQNLITLYKALGGGWYVSDNPT